MYANKFLSLCAIPLLVLSGCDEPSAAVEDDAIAVEDEDAGAAAEADGPAGLGILPDDPSALTCDYAGSYTNTLYTYNYGGFSYTLEVHKSAGFIYYQNVRTDGGWWNFGTMNRWTDCPTGNEQAILDPFLNKNGEDLPAKTCTHVCLSGTKEELHCPNAQLALNRVSRATNCVHANTTDWRVACDTGASDPGYCDAVFGTVGAECLASCETCWSWHCDDVLESGQGHLGLLACNRDRPTDVGIDGCFADGGSNHNGGGSGGGGGCPSECVYNNSCLCPQSF